MVHRFPNGVVEIDGGLRWDFDALFAEVLAGLAAAATVAAVQDETITSIGIDTWAVDYGLVNTAGELTAQPYSYRDDRSRAAVAPVHQKLDPARLYGTTGLQFLQFNTLYQLATEPDLDGAAGAAHPGPDRVPPDRAAPDRSHQRLHHRPVRRRRGGVGHRVPDRAGPAQKAVPAAGRSPAKPSGRCCRRSRPRLACRPAPRWWPSARTTPRPPSPPSRRQEENFAYISSGTWSLVGLELKHPVLTEASREANFTNERGVDGTIRYLRNMGGLWLLSECQRSWAAEGFTPELTALLTAAAALPPGGPQINPDDSYFIAPDNMPDRIRAAVRRTGDVLPDDPAAITRCIMDSLATGYARTIRDAERLADRTVDVVHVVGGGSQNRLLCQLTADATGKRVIAGPVEATALGNVLVQARAAGQVTGGLTELRSLVVGSHGLQSFTPELSRL